MIVKGVCIPLSLELPVQVILETPPNMRPHSPAYIQAYMMLLNWRDRGWGYGGFERQQVFDSVVSEQEERWGE